MHGNAVVNSAGAVACSKRNTKRTSVQRVASLVHPILNGVVGAVPVLVRRIVAVPGAHRG